MVGGRHADEATAAALEQRLRAAPDTEQKLRFFGALAGSPEPARISRNVALAYSGVIPNGRIVLAITAVAANSDNPEAVWSAVRASQAALRVHLAPWSQTSLLPAAAQASTDPGVASAMLADPASSASSGARIEAAKASGRIATTIALRGRAQPAIAAWLRQHQSRNG